MWIWLFMLSVVHGQDPVVNTSLGLIRGRTGYGFNVYKGVPFGQSTGGQNRWKPPIPVAPWTPTELQAFDFRPACMQSEPISRPPNLPVSEDCLHLNIWTPLPKGQNSSWPVMVWFYGGGFFTGNNADSEFWGDYLSNTSNVVLVTVNYRVGALGFLHSNELEGNYGLMDQLLALQWVQTNIAAFGGNPSSVTIFGQSAGAMSVSAHVVSSRSKGLFHKAIMESTVYGLLYRNLTEDLRISEAFARSVHCALTDLDCLRAVPAKEIVRVQTVPIYIEADIHLPLSTKEILPWAPNIGPKSFLTDQPLALMRAGLYNPVPIVLGTTDNETNGFLDVVRYAGPIGSHEYEFAVRAFFSSDAVKILTHYPPIPDIGAKNNSLLNNFNRLMSDYLFKCPSRYATQDTPNTYLYHWLHGPSMDPENMNKACMGPPSVPCHACEIAYVFNSIRLDPGNYSFTVGEQALSTQTMAYWAQFARTGNPNIDTNEGLSWPSTGSGESLGFNLTTSVLNNYRGDLCDFWDTIGYVH